MINLLFRGTILLIVAGVVLLYVTVRDPNEWP
jgi:hypothetical protein